MELKLGVRMITKILLLLSITTLQAFLDESVANLKKNKECLRCDLSFWASPHTDLSGYKLNESQFNFSNLLGSDITGADLSSSSLQNTLLVDTWLSGTNFSNASGEGANLRGADASGSNFTNANFMGAFFYGTKLVTADFTNTNLMQAGLSDADLREAIFNGTRLEYTLCNNKTQLPKGYICEKNKVRKQEE